MKKFWSILTFTYKETIRNKALIISTIITLIVMLGFFNMDKIVGLFNREGSKDLIMISTEANNKFFDSNTLESLNDDDFKVVLSKDSEETNNVKKEIENGNYDEIIDYILSAYSEGLNIFYKEGVKSFFEEFAKTNDKNLHAIIGILDSQRETITNLNKKIKTQEERINKLEQEIEAISKKI